MLTLSKGFVILAAWEIRLEKKTNGLLRKFPLAVTGKCYTADN